VRTTIVFQTFSDIQFFLNLLQERAVCCPTVIQFGTRHPRSDAASSRHIMQVMRVRNRFDPNISGKQLVGGYRDLSLKIKMGFMCTQSNSDYVKFVPVDRWCDSNVKRIIFEMQLHLDGMQLGDDVAGPMNQSHAVYVDARNIMSL
jgi:hypothetical protein